MLLPLENQTENRPLDGGNSIGEWKEMPKRFGLISGVLFAALFLGLIGRIVGDPLQPSQPVPLTNDVDGPHLKAEVWKLDPDPEVVIGLVDGPEEYVFPGISDVTALSDGTIVVSVGTRRYFQLRFFDSHGVFLTEAGSFGDGPFEIGDAGHHFTERLTGDSLFVLGEDYRFSVFGPRGEAVRSGRIQFPAWSATAGLVDGGHIWLQKNVDSAPAGPGEFAPPVTLSSLPVDTGRPESVVTIEGTSQWYDGENRYFRLPFATQALWAGGAGWIWYGNSGSRELRAFSPGRRSKKVVIIDVGKTPVSRADERRFKEFQLHGLSGERLRAFERFHRRTEFPDSFPLFKDLKIDSSGNLWLLRWAPPWSDEDHVWDILTSEGDPVAELSVPVEIPSACLRRRPFCLDMRLLEFGDDYLLLKHTDEIGIQRVKRYRLLK